LRILIIDCTQVDFVKNKSHYEQIKDLLKKNYPMGITQVSLI